MATAVSIRNKHRNKKAKKEPAKPLDVEVKNIDEYEEKKAKQRQAGRKAAQTRKRNKELAAKRAEKDKKEKQCIYQSEEKQQYRNKVWSLLADKTKQRLINDSRARVLLFPAINGQEIETALAHGIPENKIIALEKDKKIIDQFTWRDKYPKVEVVNGDLVKLCRKLLRRKAKIAAANFDFCNNFGRELVQQLQAGMKLPHYPDWSFCFTMAIGRESDVVSFFMNRLEGVASYYDARDDGTQDKRGAVNRAVVSDVRLLAALTYGVVDKEPFLTMEHEGRYTNSKTPMIWCCLSSFNTLELQNNEVDIEDQIDCTKALTLKEARYKARYGMTGWHRHDWGNNVKKQRNSKIQLKDQSGNHAIHHIVQDLNFSAVSSSECKACGAQPGYHCIKPNGGKYWPPHSLRKQEFTLEHCYLDGDLKTAEGAKEW